MQLADEIHRSGRPVTVSVGEHVRMPRVYRGKDIRYWFEVTGLSDERYDEVDDIVRARTVPSPQLVGTPERLMLDLNALTGQGVRMVGPAGLGITDGKAQLSGSLHNKCNRSRPQDGPDAARYRRVDHRERLGRRVRPSPPLPADPR